MAIDFLKKTRQNISLGELSLTFQSPGFPGSRALWQIILPLSLTFAISFIRSWILLALALVALIILTLFLRVSWKKLVIRAGALGLFTFVIFLPSLFWGQSLSDVSFLAVRSLLIISCALLPVLSMGWFGVLRTLRENGFPSLIIILLELSTRFILLLLKEARESWEGAESRTISLKGKEGRKIAASRVAMLFLKTLALTDEVHDAMVARGYADF